jgi:gliding motility-associated-like protein
MKKYYLSFVCLFATILLSYSQSDCSNALPVCSDANSGGVVNGFGIDDFNSRTVSGCLRQGLGAETIETNSYWFRIKLSESGQFGFNIKPTDLSEDWDFAVYGPGPTCEALGAPIVCNYSKASPSGYTGAGLDPTTNSQTDAYDAWMTVAVGDEYSILINQYSGNNTGFSIKWTGAVMTRPDPLDCSILVDLGPDRDFCVGESTELNATTFGNGVTYKWFEFNSVTGVFEPMVEVTAIISVSNSGNYKVDVTDINGPVGSDDIVVTFSEVPIAGATTDMAECDSDADGFADFDLESQTATIIGSQTGMSVTYHETEILAKTGVAAQSSPYTSNGAKIWVRVENSLNDSCYDMTSFNISLLNSASVVQLPDLQLCDDNTDGEMVFDMSVQISLAENGQTGMEVKFFDNEDNAIAKKGWIVDPSIYLSETKTIWVRVEPSGGSNCEVITAFEIRVLKSPTANIATDLQVCDDNNNGSYDFDFNELKDVEILGAQSATDFSISYYNSMSDATAGLSADALPNPYTNATPYALETVYARISNTNYSECYDITNFTIQVFDTALPLSPSEIPDFSVCDDTSDGDDTNGKYTFNLTDYEPLILNGQSNLVFDITYFEDAAYITQISNITAFDNKIAGGEPIYVRVTSSNSNNTTCYSDTSFNLEVKPLPNSLMVPFDFFQCDIDGTFDGITDFNLAEADLFLSRGNTSLNVSYHLSSLDAESGVNPQNKYPFSNVTVSRLYARVEDAAACFRVVVVNLEASTTSFPPSYNKELITCDDDAVVDGIHVFDLTQTTSEIISLFSSQSLRVSFYRNEMDAIEEVNVINTPDVYLNETAFSQRLWVRVESSTNGGCFAIKDVLELTVNPRPEFELDDTAVLCLNNLPLTVSTFNPQDNYTYEWTDTAGAIISVQPFADLVVGGVYTVIATSALGCRSFPEVITVRESIIADIDQDDVIVTDNSDRNSITINTANDNLGIGDYEFTLNDPNGIYQDSPVFTDVIPGKYIVYVREKNNCGLNQVTVYVFGFPKFFTPNNDNSNDTWQVLGVNLAVFPESSISIYDRYGQFMSTFDLNNQGWDGTYGRNLMALSSDYWYVVQLIDLEGVLREYRGHFSLIRR